MLYVEHFTFKFHKELTGILSLITSVIRMKSKLYSRKPSIPTVIRRAR